MVLFEGIFSLFALFVAELTIFKDSLHFFAKQKKTLKRFLMSTNFLPRYFKIDGIDLDNIIGFVG